MKENAVSLSIINKNGVKNSICFLDLANGELMV